jgi:hypothetical protein
LDYFTASSDVSYYGYETKAISTSSVGVRNSRGDGLSLGYAQGWSIRSNYSDLTNPSRVIFGSRSESAVITAYFKSTYLDFSGTTAYDMINSNFSSFTLSGLIKPPGKCWGLGFFYNKVFGGDTALLWSLPIFFGEDRSFEVNKPQGI